MGAVVAGVGYVALYAATILVLRGHPTAAAIAGNTGLLLPPLVLGAVVLRRRRQWRGCQRLFFATLAVSSCLWMLGHLGWLYDRLLLGQTRWLGWHTIFTLCGAIGPLIALLTRPYLGVRAAAFGGVSIGLASYGLFVVFVYSYLVLVPSLLLSESEAQAALLGLVQGNRSLLLGAALLTLAAAWRTPWRRAFLYFTGATLIGAVLRAQTSLAIAAGEYEVGSLYDLAWVVPFVGYAVVAMDAPASPREDERLESPRNALPAAVAAVPVLLIPLFGYGWLFLQPLDNPADPFRALLTGLMTVAGLGLLTLRLAAQGTELQRADARLRLLAAATEQTAELILITRADGAIEHANDAFVRALGYPRAELMRLSFAELMDRPLPSAALRIREDVRNHGIWRGTLVRRRKDGSTFPAACTVVRLKDDTGKGTHLVGVERDISDEVRLREQLIHSERLSAIGELVAGVAHEINNPLQTIIGSVELMMEEQRESAVRRDLEVVRREATRAGQIVRNLLSFVRRGVSDRARVDLNDIVRGTVGLREFHLQQCNIALHLELSGAPLDVLVNREEIQQIVLNLLLNAEQAILASSQAGTISVRTAMLGPVQILDVADTGPGVSRDLRGRIFEPFFTTKQVGEGTGLGLSISHGIASAHGGRLELQPSEAGACFRLTLPVVFGAGSTVTPVTARTDRRPVALVVDDEFPIRRLVGRLLERRGYRTLEAETGEVALSLAADARPDLVLCDVRMPGMSGPDLFHALARLEHAPERFVFITGDRASVAEDEASVAGVPVLTKPFTAADLDAVLDWTRVNG